MVVCKYWKSGTCKNGNNCRFEHPNGRNSSNYNNNNDNGNNSNNSQNRGFNSGGVFGNISRPDRWHLNEDDIRSDLTPNDRGGTQPKWLLSAYGPGKEPPASLFNEYEFSPEEVRWRFYEQAALGNAEGADNESKAIWQKAAASVAEVAKNPPGVQKYMQEQEREHPNRYDFCKMAGDLSRDDFAKKTQLNTQPGTSVNPWGGATRATTNTNPFSKPAFGQSPFGQGPSTGFGQSAQPAFGQSGFGGSSSTTLFGKPTPAPAFGQNAFNQPKSTFGQQPQGPSPFGTTPASASTNPAFGQPSAFGTTTNNTGSAFNQTSTPGTDNSTGGAGFGQATNLGGANNPFAKPSAAAGFSAGTAGGGFGQSGFGQPAQPAQPAGSQSPFGQQANTQNTQSPFSQANTQNTQSPFGQSSAPKPQSPFGQTSTQNTQSPFGQTNTQSTQSPFGQASAQNVQSPFGQTNTQNTSNAFAAKSTAAPGFGVGSGFGQKPQAAPGFGVGAAGGGFAQPGFGQPSQPQQPASQSPFGQPKPLTNTQTPNQPNDQGMDTAPAASSNPFGPAPGIQPQNRSQSHPVAGVSQSTTAVTSTAKPTSGPIHPLHYSQTLPSVPPTFAGDKVITYRTLPITYETTMKATAEAQMVIDQEIPRYARPDNRKWERVWFPAANNEPGVQKLLRTVLDYQADEDQYTDEVKQQYGRLFETGAFEAGRIPMVPPMRGWVDYDF